MADKKIADLDAIATGDVLSAAVFEIQNVGGAIPESRKLTKAQMATLFAGGGGGESRVPFVYDADATHTVSAGVTRIDVEAWGGGGGAGDDGNDFGGGGGGAYAATFNITVAESDAIAVTVGAAGIANPSGDGGNGGDSFITLPDTSVPVLAAAGYAGGPTGSSLGGAVASCTGDIKLAGQPGMGPEAVIATVGCSGGSSPLGGWGALVDMGGTNLKPATAPGGGGGAQDPFQGGPGEQLYHGGRKGRVIVWEYQP